MTKQEMIDKILYYMKEKGKIIDEKMGWSDRTFYTKKDEKALKRRLLLDGEDELMKLIVTMCEDELMKLIVTMCEGFSCDGNICPFCYYWNENCIACPYANNGHLKCDRTENSTWYKIIQNLGEIHEFPEIRELINRVFGEGGNKK